MGTTDLTVGAGASEWQGHNKFFVMENIVDLGADGTATGEVIQALSIPAGTSVLNVHVEVIEQMALTATATVGDGAGAADWDASTDLDGAVGTITEGISGTDAYALTGKTYAAADTIDLTCTIAAGPAALGKYKVTALCVKIS